VDPVEYLKQSDNLLSRLITHVLDSGQGSNEEPKTTDYESLVSSVVSQQLSTKSAGAIFARLSDSLRDSGITPESMAAMSFEELRAIGLSGSKISYIQGIAQSVMNGDINLSSLYEKDDEEAISELQKLRGIGRWTAEMFLMFQMDREDVFPVKDWGIRTAMIKLYSLEKDVSDTELIVFAAKWSPYRTLASRFLWRGLDTGYFV